MTMGRALISNIKETRLRQLLKGLPATLAPYIYYSCLYIIYVYNILHLLCLLLLVPRLEIGVVVLMGGDGKTYRHTERSNLLICIIPISSSPAARLWLSLGECVHPLPSAQVDQLSAPRFSLLCPRERPKRGIQTHTHDSIIHSRCTVSVAIHVAILTPEEQLLVRRVYYSVHAHTAFRY